MAKSAQMTFVVSEKILRVQTTQQSPTRVETMAFPVDNIARVVVTPIRPDYSRAILEFLVGMAIVGLLLAGAGEVADELTSLAVVVAVILTVRLLVVLSTRPYYVLLVETTGPPFAKLASRDKAEVELIGQQIVSAINNPQATFQYRVEHLHIGDTVKLIGGSGNIGKVGKWAATSILVTE
jgi:uncharacterized protein DUF6232